MEILHEFIGRKFFYAPSSLRNSGIQSIRHLEDLLSHQKKDKKIPLPGQQTLGPKFRLDWPMGTSREALNSYQRWENKDIYTYTRATGSLVRVPNVNSL